MENQEAFGVSRKTKMNRRRGKLKKALFACVGEPIIMSSAGLLPKGEWYYNKSDLEPAEEIKTMAEKLWKNQEKYLRLFRIKTHCERERLKCRILVILDESCEEETLISFQLFSEVAFYSIDGKIEPLPCIDKPPLFTLVFPNDGESFFFRNSGTIENTPFIFNRFINRFMIINDCFRNIMCSILSSMEWQIFKDIVKTVQRDHCLLLPFTIDEYLSYEDAEDLIRENNWSGIPTQSLNMSLNQWYYLIQMSQFIQDKDWNTLTEYCMSRTDYFNEDDQINDGPDPIRFFTNYLMTQNPSRDQQSTWRAVNDYICFTQDEKEELLSIKEIEDL